MLIPLGLHHIVNTYIWFLYGDYTVGTEVYTGELTRFAQGDPRPAASPPASTRSSCSACPPLRWR